MQNPKKKRLSDILGAMEDEPPEPPTPPDEEFVPVTEPTPTTGTNLKPKKRRY